MSLKKWLYKGGHPNALAKLINKGWAVIHSSGLYPNYLVTLEVVGRRSGKLISLPLALTTINGERYLVSMLGEEANWVRNVKAAGGRVRLHHGKTEEVFLEDVDIPQRATIIKAYLQIAPGARPHIPVDKNAPITEFEKIAAKYPVFKINRGKS